jgi:RNA polymerase primary sigma factor
VLFSEFQALKFPRQPAPGSLWRLLCLIVFFDSEVIHARSKAQEARPDRRQACQETSYQAIAEASRQKGSSQGSQQGHARYESQISARQSPPKPNRSRPKKPSKVKANAAPAKAAPVAAAELPVKKKPGRPPKAASALNPTHRQNWCQTRPQAQECNRILPAAMTGHGRHRGRPGRRAGCRDGEKVKPLRMKISKAKERALMKEFGLDETVLSEEDMAKRRLRLKP